MVDMCCMNVFFVFVEVFWVNFDWSRCYVCVFYLCNLMCLFKVVNVKCIFDEK